uniref:Uncharacterized protein n=1 Tax=Parascaris equorum TaxID=6256 RepID=A0A914RBW8_PAREQ
MCICRAWMRDISCCNGCGCVDPQLRVIRQLCSLSTPQLSFRFGCTQRLPQWPHVRSSSAWSHFSELEGEEYEIAVLPSLPIPRYYGSLWVILFLVLPGEDLQLQQRRIFREIPHGRF